MDHDDRFATELGVYIGPVDVAEAVKTLKAHTPGEWVCRLTNPLGEIVWNKSGWSLNFVDNDESATFAVARTEQGAGNPSMFVDAPLVLSFAKGLDFMGSCDQYSGGLVFGFDFGDYKDHTLTLLAWHGVYHLNESGDIAPGLGAFNVSDEATEGDAS